MATVYRVRLEDDFSGPAGSVVRAARAMKQEASGAGSALGSVGQGGLSASQGMSSAVAVGGLVSAAFQKIAEVGARVVGVLVDIGKAAGAQIAEGVRFGDQMRFSLEMFLPPGEDAAATLEELSAQARRLGQDTQTAGRSFQGLISAGFTKGAAMELVAFKADLVALEGGGEEAAAKIDQSFENIKKAMATGRFEADQFNSILESTPVTKMQVLEKLSEKTGKSIEELAATDITKLPVDKLIESFKDAALEATGVGAAGDLAAAKARQGFSGFADMLRANVTNALTDIGVKMGPGLEAKVMPALGRLSTALGFEDVNVDSLTDQIANELVNVLEKAINIATEFAESFGESFTRSNNKLSPLREGIQGLTDDSESATPSVSDLGAVVGALAGAMSTLWAFINLIHQNTLVGQFGEIAESFRGTKEGAEQVGDALAALPGIISDAASGAIDSALNLGRDIVQGIADGITNNLGIIASAAGGAAGTAISAAAGVLDTGSPSKEFAKLGGFVSEGFALGIDSKAPMAEGAIGRMVTGGMPAANDVAAPGGRAGGTFSISIPITVTAGQGASPAEVADEVSRKLERNLIDALDRHLATAAA